MTPPKKNYGILLVFMGLSAIFLTCSIILSAKQTENHRMILSLRETIHSLNSKLGSHQQAIAKIDFYRFQENVYRLRSPEFAKITDTVFNLSQKHGLNPYLIMAVIFVESRFDRHAVSKAGAYGLMQINYAVWKDKLQIDFKKLSRIDYNIELGLIILKQYLQETSGDIFQALLYYNNGYQPASNRYNEKIIATNFYKHAGIG